MKSIILICLLFISSHLFSQEIFSEKYAGCASCIFSLEKDTTEVKLDRVKLLSVFKETVSSKIFNKIRGDLSLQVIVDTFGNPCLISIENKTNINSGKLNLKKIFDKSLLWSKPHRNVSVLLLLQFTEEGVSFRRIGHNGYGWSTLRE